MMPRPFRKPTTAWEPQKTPKTDNTIQKKIMETPPRRYQRVWDGPAWARITRITR
jgi:hypothetical protein